MADATSRPGPPQAKALKALINVGPIEKRRILALSSLVGSEAWPFALKLCEQLSRCGISVRKNKSTFAQKTAHLDRLKLWRNNPRRNLPFGPHCRASFPRSPAGS